VCALVNVPIFLLGERMCRGYEIALWILFAASSATDLLWGKIYNGVTLTFLFFGLIAQFYFGGVSAGGQALLSVVLAFVLFFPLYWVKAVAAGDVKLLMAAAAWADLRLVFELSVASLLIGAVVGGIVLIRKAGVGGGVTSVLDQIHGKKAVLKPHRMPFAPAFFCALFLIKIAEIYRWNVF
jgi:prepilin signal peptidase PulO-like enzyme (type II secretory pathway)